MIELDNLVKEYTRENPEGKVITNRAVDGFSFSVKDGEVLACWDLMVQARPLPLKC